MFVGLLDTVEFMLVIKLSSKTVAGMLPSQPLYTKCVGYKKRRAVRARLVFPSDQRDHDGTERPRDGKWTNA